MKVKCYIVICVVLFTACVSLKEKPLPIEKTAFYTFSIQRDTIKNQSQFKVLDVQIADTKINYHLNKAIEKEPYYIRLNIIDESKHQITALVSHPLYKRFDLYSETGEIESKSVKLQNAEFVLRVPFFSSYKTITFTETINFVNQKPITLKYEK
ncbi:MAG: hypothetical protein IT237_11125 [Bacteroidia bacterium]|nr:hypothetical protein [Bacteroidia bacterium]